MLVAGAGANDASAGFGALSFSVAGTPSGTWWNLGSAKNNQYRASTLYTGQ